MTKEKLVKKKGRVWPFLLLFLLGAGVLFYPTVSYWLAEYNQVRATQSYRQVVGQLSYEEREEMWKKAVDYNNRMQKSLVKDPFAETENIDPFDEYYDILDIGEGMMAYLQLPSIGVLLPVYHGVSDDVLEKGVGHIKATALPIGGKGTHCVLTGHTGLHTAKLFNDLDEIKKGDIFYIHTLDRTIGYRVNQIKVVKPDDITRLKAEKGRDYLTLVTCTPYGINTHRLLVRGERFDYEPTNTTAVIDKADFPWWIIAVTTVLVILLILLGRWIRKKYIRKLREREGSGSDEKE